MARYFIIYKPYGVLTQFTGEEPTLASLGNFPEEVYPIGRLDKDSEGLLLITDDKWLNHHLLNPRFGHQRTYYVQVEGTPTAQAMQQLRNGVTINSFYNVPIRTLAFSWHIFLLLYLHYEFMD